MQSLDSFVHISEPVKDAAGVAVSRTVDLRGLYFADFGSGALVLAMPFVVSLLTRSGDSRLAHWRRMSAAPVFYSVQDGRPPTFMSLYSMVLFQSHLGVISSNEHAG